MKAIKLPADTMMPATIVEVDFDSIDPDKPGTAQHHVSGWIEIIRLPPWFRNGDKVRLIVDEEGVLKGKTYNPRASTFYAGPQIVGNALLVGYTQYNEFIDIPDEWIQLITDAEGVEELTLETSDQKI